MNTTHILAYGLLAAVGLATMTYALASGLLGGRAALQPNADGATAAGVQEPDDTERRRQRKAAKKRRRDRARAAEERRREAQREREAIQNDPAGHLTWVYRTRHAYDASSAARGLDEATRADDGAQADIDGLVNEEFGGVRPTTSEVLHHRGFAAGWVVSTVIAVALDYILFKEVLHDQLTLLGAGISLVSTIVVAYLIEHARRTWHSVDARRQAALLYAAAVFATAVWGTVLVILGLARGQAMNDDAIAKDRANISAIKSDPSLAGSSAGQLALKNAEETLARAETAKSTQTVILTLAALAATAGDILLWPNLGWVAAAERLKRLDATKRTTADALDAAKRTVSETQNRVVAGLTDELHRHEVPINDDIIRRAAGGQAAAPTEQPPQADRPNEADGPAAAAPPEGGNEQPGAPDAPAAETNPPDGPILRAVGPVITEPPPDRPGAGGGPQDPPGRGVNFDE